MGGEAGTGEQQLALPAGEEVAVRFLELHLLFLLCFSSHFCDPFLYHLTAQRLQVLSYSNQRISTSQLLRVWSPVHTGLLLRGRARPGFPHSSV